MVPPGTVVAFAGSTPPPGWLLCNGSAVTRTQYSTLFAAIGTAHGIGNGSTTFNLPDYRGRFLRGKDGGVGRDPDRATRTAANPGGNVGDAVGSIQGYATHLPGNPFVTSVAGAHFHYLHSWKYVFGVDPTGSYGVLLNFDNNDTVTSTDGAHSHTITHRWRQRNSPPKRLRELDYQVLA